jgi:hypothetical protein
MIFKWKLVTFYYVVLFNVSFTCANYVEPNTDHQWIMNCKGSRRKRLHTGMSGVTERTRKESHLSPGRYLNIRCAKYSPAPFGSFFIRSSSETFILFMENVHEIKLRWQPPEIWRHVDANLLLTYPRSLLPPSSGQRRIFLRLLRRCTISQQRCEDLKLHKYSRPAFQRWPCPCASL